MVIRRKRIVLIGTILAGGIAAILVGITILPKDSPGPGEVARTLIVDPSCLDMGEVWETSSHHWQLRVTNHSHADVAIGGFLTSCTCVSISPKSLTLHPSQEATLDLRLDLTQKYNVDAARTDHLFQVRIVPQVQGQVRFPVRPWTIKARVKKILTGVPQKLSLAGPLVRGQRGPLTRLMIESTVPLTELRVSCDNSLVEVAIIKNEANNYVLLLQPTTTVASPSLSASIALVPVHNGELLPALTFSAMGVVRDDIQAQPQHIWLGARTMGEAVEEHVLIHSLSHRCFSLMSQPTSNAVGAVVEEVDRKDGTRSVRLKCKINHRGNTTITIPLSVKQDDDSTLPLVLTVSYFGLPS